jgi:hypothetical protein
MGGQCVGPLFLCRFGHRFAPVLLVEKLKWDCRSPASFFSSQSDRAKDGNGECARRKWPQLHPSVVTLFVVSSCISFFPLKKEFAEMHHQDVVV